MSMALAARRILDLANEGMARIKMYRDGGKKQIFTKDTIIIDHPDGWFQCAEKAGGWSKKLEINDALLEQVKPTLQPIDGQERDRIASLIGIMVADEAEDEADVPLLNEASSLVDGGGDPDAANMSLVGTVGRTRQYRRLTPGELQARSRR